ncbi:MAG: GNVR domain-containing protein, partial [Desulfobacteraceae bacterium]
METTLPVHDKQKSTYDLHTHLSDYLSVIYRHKWIVFCCFLLIVTGVTVFSLLSTPIYEAATQVIIKEQPSPLNPLGKDTEKNFTFSEYFQTQVNLLSNRSLVWEVVNSQNIRRLIEQAIIQEDDSQEIFDSQEKIGALKKQDIIDWYLEHLSVTPLLESNLVRVSFSGTDPEMITKIVNAHAQIAIGRNIRIQKANAHKALDWLKNQIKDQKKEVEEAQQILHTYQKENDLLTIKDRQNLISEELDQVNADLVEARKLRIARQAAFDQLQKAGTEQEMVLALPEIVNDSVLLSLRNRLVELKAKKIEMATKYGEKHPKMIQLTLGINQLKNEINGEIKRLKNSINADLKRAISIESNLMDTLEKKKTAAMALGERNIEYDVLRRQADSSEELYDFLLKQSEEISLSSVMDSSNIQVVDKAEIPEKPVKPNHLVNIGLSIIMGILFSSGLAFFIEYMDNSVKDAMDISMRLGLPVLGIVYYDKKLKKNAASVLPWLEKSKSKKKYSGKNRKYPYPDRFPVLIKTAEDGSSGRVIVIESASMEEGKTTIAIKAATSMASSGMRTLLVDCDLVRPRLSSTVGNFNGNGLAEFFKKIINYQLDYGQLSTCSIDDLFFLISLKKKNGHLIVTNSDGERMEAFFQNGSLVHLQNPNSQDIKRLGTMLVNSELITEDQ